jgi:hypothetical protein
MVELGRPNGLGFHDEVFAIRIEFVGHGCRLKAVTKGCNLEAVVSTVMGIEGAFEAMF